MILSDYKANGRKSVGRVEDAITHLKDYFEESEKVINITGDRVTSYTIFRQEEEAAASTINNELAALSRMFVLGIICHGGILLDSWQPSKLFAFISCQ